MSQQPYQKETLSINKTINESLALASLTGKSIAKMLKLGIIVWLIYGLYA